MGIYETWVESTNFGTVRGFVQRARSPVSGVLLVQTRRLLPLVVAAIEISDKFAQQRLRAWLESGRIRFGGDGGVGWGLDRIPDDEPCEVIYLPPLYIVWLNSWDWAQVERPVFMSKEI